MLINLKILIKEIIIDLISVLGIYMVSYKVNGRYQNYSVSADFALVL